MSSKILILGATGCVGHYIVEELGKNKDYELHLPIRADAHHFFDLKQKNLVFHHLRLSEIRNHVDLLNEMDFVIHLATAWGGSHIWQTNIGDNIWLFNQLAESPKLKKIFYFSTASILGEDGRATYEALTQGTGYVRSKYMFYKEIPKLKTGDKLVTLFPTWVLGGSSKHPYSHASSGIEQAPKFLPLLTRLKIPFQFHFIHSADIALMLRAMIENPKNLKSEYILGQKAYTLNQLLQELSGQEPSKKQFQIPFDPAWLIPIAKIIRHPIALWDQYCLKRKKFVFETTRPEDLGYTSVFPSFLK